MNNSLINQTFNKAKRENRPVLLTYTVAGDNTKKKSLEILKSISDYADICELGFPHNTPIADGGQIQTSAYRAIQNGIKINDVFSIVSKFKKIKKNKPIILMGYYNMIFQYNENKFIAKCKKSKVDGLIVVDLPYPENKSFALKCKRKKINFIQLISPTTSKLRLKKMTRNEKKINGRIQFISPVAQRDTRTFKVELETPNPRAQIPEGITAELILPLPETLAHQLSPSLFSLDENGNLGVKIINGERRVQFKPITIVGGSEDKTFVTGLPDPSNVIVAGHGFVMHGQIVKAVAETTSSGKQS